MRLCFTCGPAQLGSLLLHVWLSTRRHQGHAGPERDFQIPWLSGGMFRSHYRASPDSTSPSMDERTSREDRTTKDATVNHSTMTTTTSCVCTSRTSSTPSMSATGSRRRKISPHTGSSAVSGQSNPKDSSSVQSTKCRGGTISPGHSIAAGCLDSFQPADSPSFCPPEPKNRDRAASYRGRCRTR